MSGVVSNPTLMDHPGYVSGRYYTAFVRSGPTTLLITENRLYFFPVFVFIPASIDRLGFNISAGAGDATCQVRTGVYSSGGGRPSTLLQDAGFTTVGVGTGNVNPTVNLMLNRGWYWLALISNRNGGAGAMPTVRAQTNSPQNLLNMVGGVATSDASNLVSAAYHAQTVGTWSSYTLPTAAPTVTLDSAGMPEMYFRKA